MKVDKFSDIVNVRIYNNPKIPKRIDAYYNVLGLELKNNDVVLVGDKDNVSVGVILNVFNIDPTKPVEQWSDYAEGAILSVIEFKDKKYRYDQSFPLMAAYEESMNKVKEEISNRRYTRALSEVKNLVKSGELSSDDVYDMIKKCNNE